MSRKKYILSHQHHTTHSRLDVSKIDLFFMIRHSQLALQQALAEPPEHVFQEHELPGGKVPAGQKEKCFPLHFKGLETEIRKQC